MSFIYDDYPVFSYNYGYDPYNYGNNEVIMNQMDVAPNFNEVLFSNFPYNNDDQYIVLNHFGESIYNKWQYLDHDARILVRNKFKRLYPGNMLFDINNYDDADSFIGYLVNEYPYSLNNRSYLTLDDLISLHLTDGYLSTRLSKIIKEQCENTKIKKLTKAIWKDFKGKTSETLSDKDCYDFKKKNSDFKHKDDDDIQKIYNLLKICEKKRKRSGKTDFDIDALLSLFDDCDMDGLGNAIDEYEKKKKYLLNKKYLDKKYLDKKYLDKKHLDKKH